MTGPHLPDDAEVAGLLRAEAELPLGLRARVEARVMQALGARGDATWGERAALASVALCVVGAIPGGLLAGPLILVAWGVAAMYGALLDLEDDPTP